jgi:hypothetical protein
MKIKKWLEPNEQFCHLGNESWSVARLFELSRNLPVMEIPLDYLCMSSTYEKLNLRDIVMHMNAVNDADLDKPIILSEDGDIMDGRHRVMKALLLGNKTIKTVRFDENPEPCRVKD